MVDNEYMDEEEIKLFKKGLFSYQNIEVYKHMSNKTKSNITIDYRLTLCSKCLGCNKLEMQTFKGINKCDNYRSAK